MELQDDLYTVMKETLDDNGWQCEIALNPTCFIYQAHFPGEPITPGACLLQIAKELLEDHLHLSLSIDYIKDVKFISVVTPEETPIIVYRFQSVNETGDSEVKAKVLVSHEEKPLCTLSFTCKQQ